MQHQLIANLLNGDQKCMDKRNLVNRRLTYTIKLIRDYVIRDKVDYFAHGSGCEVL